VTGFTPKRAAAALAVLVATGLLLAWGPTADRRARSRSGKVDAAIAKRELHVSAAELATLMRSRQTDLAIYDLRGESEYNRFHLLDAKRLILDDAAVERIRTMSDKTVKILVADDEKSAERAARTLLVAGAKQVYLLAGGIASWPALFPRSDRLLLAGALGARHPLSEPGDAHFEPPRFQPKVKLASGGKKGPGGCGG
jgi:rhodanese-related sulfurtransferase